MSRDMPVPLKDLQPLLSERNQEVSAVPVYIFYEHNAVMSNTIFIAPDLPAKSSPTRHQVEEILFDLISPQHRLLFCVQR